MDNTKTCKLWLKWNKKISNYFLFIWPPFIDKSDIKITFLLQHFSERLRYFFHDRNISMNRQVLIVKKGNLSQGSCLLLSSNVSKKNRNRKEHHHHDFYELDSIENCCNQNPLFIVLGETVWKCLLSRYSNVIYYKYIERYRYNQCKWNTAIQVYPKLPNVYKYY